LQTGILNIKMASKPAGVALLGLVWLSTTPLQSRRDGTIDGFERFSLRYAISIKKFQLSHHPPPAAESHA